MYRLRADQPLTRRKTMHHVEDIAGNLLYSNGRLGPCIAWIHMQGQSQFLLQVEVAAQYPDFLVTLTPFETEGPSPEEIEEAMKRLKYTLKTMR